MCAAEVLSPRTVLTRGLAFLENCSESSFQMPCTHEHTANNQSPIGLRKLDSTSPESLLASSLIPDAPFALPKCDSISLRAVLRVVLCADICS